MFITLAGVSYVLLRVKTFYNNMYILCFLVYLNIVSLHCLFREGCRYSKCYLNFSDKSDKSLFIHKLFLLHQNKISSNDTKNDIITISGQLHFNFETILVNFVKTRRHCYFEKLYIFNTKNDLKREKEFSHPSIYSQTLLMVRNVAFL